MPCKTINSGGKTYCGIGKNKTKHSWKPSCARTGDCSGKFKLQVMERIHEQIVDITGLVNPQFSSTALEPFFATGRWFIFSFRVWCASVQPSPSGTDRCRGDDPEHSWKPRCARKGDRSGNSSTVCRTQCTTMFTLCFTPFCVWFDWPWSYWVYDEILTERGTLSLPPQSVRLFELSLRQFATCVWLQQSSNRPRERNLATLL